jgi:hypothetical protein
MWVNSAEDVSHARRPKTTSVKIVALFFSWQIASIVGIPLGVAQTILEHDLKIRSVCANWIPHLRTD